MNLKLDIASILDQSSYGLAALEPALFETCSMRPAGGATQALGVNKIKPDIPVMVVGFLIVCIKFSKICKFVLPE